MGSRLAVGDRVVCKVKDNQVVSINGEGATDTQVFDIISLVGSDRYVVYVPYNVSLKNSVYVSAANYKQFGVHKRFIDSYVCVITEHNVFAIHSRVDGMCCTDCGEFYAMAATNRGDGTFACWACRHYPFYK
jgi:hypothetical protein